MVTHYGKWAMDASRHGERRDRKVIMAFSRQTGRRSLTRWLGLHRFSDDWGAKCPTGLK